MLISLAVVEMINVFLQQVIFMLRKHDIGERRNENNNELHINDRVSEQCM
jgi:hypothetical protein